MLFRSRFNFYSFSCLFSQKRKTLPCVLRAPKNLLNHLVDLMINHIRVKRANQHLVGRGGRYRISFDMESGEYSEVGGTYREVVPNEKLVFSWAWHSTPERESEVTVSIKPDGAGALLTLHHEKFFNEAARDGHEKGWNELLTRLEASIA